MRRVLCRLPGAGLRAAKAPPPPPLPPARSLPLSRRHYCAGAARRRVGGTDDVTVATAGPVAGGRPQPEESLRRPPRQRWTAERGWEAAAADGGAEPGGGWGPPSPRHDAAGQEAGGVPGGRWGGRWGLDGRERAEVAAGALPGTTRRQPQGSRGERCRGLGEGPRAEGRFPPPASSRFLAFANRPSSRCGVGRVTRCSSRFFNGVCQQLQCKPTTPPPTPLSTPLQQIC